MRRSRGKILLCSVVVVAIIFCLVQFSSRLHDQVISHSVTEEQSFSDSFKEPTVSSDIPQKKSASTTNLDDGRAAAFNNNTTHNNTILIEKRWSTINETTSKGIHLFTKTRIENIRLIGERHSGTSFLTRHLKKCFPDVSVGDYLVNRKHWMQPTPDYVVQAAKRYGEEGLQPTLMDVSGKREIVAQTWWDIANAPNPKSVFNTSLVLVLVRNPYDWLEAMRQKPWHWPNHVDVLPRNETVLNIQGYNNNNNGRQTDQTQKRRRLQATSGTGDRRRRTKPTIYDTPRGESMGGTLPLPIPGQGPFSVHKSFITKSTLEWKEFINRPMRLLEDDQEKIDTGVLCQKGYPFGTISPCLRNRTYVPTKVQHIPRPFLRNLPFDVNDVIYELPGSPSGKPYQHPLQLRAAKIQNFLRLVQEWELGGFGLIRYEDNILGDGVSVVVEQISQALQVTATCPPLAPFDKPAYNLTDEFLDWITTHSAWDLESILGYAPRR